MCQRRAGRPRSQGEGETPAAPMGYASRNETRRRIHQYDYPHIVQGMQRIMTRNEGIDRYALIAYSLGNFVFDSPRTWSKSMNESLILRCEFNQHGLVACDAVPVLIDGYRPRLAGGMDAKGIMARLENLSAALIAN